MGGKYKKFLRSEKAKVKLKGAKLPKGLNVTKTDFKVKKITIREQLAETGTESKKEQSVKEILTRLKHHNSSFRMTALKSLKDVINTNAAAVIRNLGQIVQGISANCLDIENDIRRESFRTMSLLFSAVGMDSVRPFFEVISSYLRCAMTHITPSIQEDALLFLDVLMKYIPNLVAESGDAIFVNFLDMISKLKEDHKQGRALTVNVSRMKTTKWRIKALQRLREIFDTILRHRTSMQVLPEHSSSQNQVYFNGNEKLYFPLSKSNLRQANSIDIFKTAPDNGFEAKDEGEQLKRYISVLMPLLLDTWVEVRPFSMRTDKSVDRQPLSAEGTYTLKIVLDIFECLWGLIRLWEKKIGNDELSRMYREEHGENFVLHFFTSFPYEQRETSKESKKETKQFKGIIADDPFCTQQNLAICHLYCEFFHKNIQKHSDVSRRILEFLTQIFNKVELGRSGYTTYIQKAIRSVLFENGIEFINLDNDETRKLLRQVLAVQKNKRSRENCEANFLTLLCDVVLDDLLYEVYGQNEFRDWLAALPELLQQQHVSRHTLQTLSILARRQNTIFLNALRQSVDKVMGSFPNTKFVGYSNEEEGRRFAQDLLYWIDFDAQSTISKGLH